MTNVLTGDYEAVLELSGSTLNRLAASMHQNAYSDPGLPSTPHGGYFRIGDGVPSGGVQGSVAVQIGTSQVLLIDGATDRFSVEMGVRARYRADPGTTPLADVIHGTLRATYRLQNVHPDCPGWGGIAGDYIWPKVMRSTVTFEGAAYNDSDSLLPVPVDAKRQDELRKRIESLLARMLATTFQPRPRHMDARYRKFITRSTPGASAVAIPVRLDGVGPAAGAIKSINSVFLDGHDFAVAVGSDAIVNKVRSNLDTAVGYQTDFHIHGDAGIGGGLEIDYHFRIDGARADWLGAIALATAGGLIQVTVDGSGWATRLHRSGVFNFGTVHLPDLNMAATVSQFLLLQFDSAGERLSLSAVAQPSISVNYHGPYSSKVVSMARKTVSEQFATLLGTYLGPANVALDAMRLTDKKTALVEQLQTLDRGAEASFVDAIFPPEGVVLRGTVGLSYRQAPVVSFEKVDADWFDAMESWIPGGRVDRLDWSWRWFANPVQTLPGNSGSRSESHSFLLRREHGSSNHFGRTLDVDNPLPGLDGSGQVCLSISGVQVDHETGALIPVRSIAQCAQFGYQFKLPFEVGPYLRVCDPARVATERARPEIGLLRTSASPDTAATHNTLVVYVGEDLDDDVAGALVAGVESCQRQFAGLLVLVLFRDGGLTNTHQAEKVDALSAALAAPAMITEDVQDRWKEFLALDNARSLPNWRLIDPAGVVSWNHNGSMMHQGLAEALDKHLVTGSPARPEHLREAIRIGDRVPVIDLLAGGCPPVPVQRPRTAGSRLAFLDTGPASTRTLRELQIDTDTSGPTWVAAVVDGASKEDIRRLSDECGSAIPLFADPNGSITRSTGIVFTPALLTIDALGLVTILQTPLAPTDAPVSRLKGSLK
ncbi:hypothetical protein [Mycobacterium sp. 1245852.3]|uniref:hypothetical protein n=1 Tax=Mycobacterium sp. 1245852.3 TaxID=1856860 RepID=UPI0012E9D28E|nr:hypothetical protein [Mycobacterium sp. 1245852.3]